ncbi:hypothetical protein KSF_096880 [Reticulibacter mediterranei]|uniref:Uncharacterized protein n=1 Tax=Reticulibacter mediterranei TaxID=2778369 RepID=A0A8J3N8L0_9CHLR|nr:hypothetical protein [Reticulibacter mediterranei]GHO99640.1 hypothetical protein KSF_096880 [Reticulibacter mediterranei]
MELVRSSAPIHSVLHPITAFSTRALIVVGVLAFSLMTACSPQPPGVDPQPGSSNKTPAASPTVPSDLAKYLQHNLIVNGDAEVGSAGDPDGTAEQQVVKELPGWTRQGTLTVFPYVAGQTIGAVGEGDPRPDDHGKNYFTGGPDGGPDALATATQSIDLTPLALVVDTGKLSYTLSGYLGSWGTFSNQAEISVQFQDASHKDLGSPAHIGPVTSGNNHQSDQATGLWKRTTSNQIPAGTRYAVVTLTISVDPNVRVAANNSANSGFADSISFMLKS